MLVQHLLQAIAERLHSNLSIHTIYGDPIEAQGKTLIPVAKVSYGFGGGAGGTNSLDCADKQPLGNTVEGGGGGGGVRMVPLGVLEVTAQQSRSDLTGIIQVVQHGIRRKIEGQRGEQ